MFAMLAMLAENLWIEVLDLTSGLKIMLRVRHAFEPSARRIFFQRSYDKLKIQTWCHGIRNNKNEIDEAC